MNDETRMKFKDIKVGPNPRSDFGDLNEIKASLREHGLLQPIVVDLKGTIIDGGRRYAAIKELIAADDLSETHFPDQLIPVTKRDSSVITSSEQRLVANIHRKDLTPIEEGIAFKEYIDARKVHVDTLAAKISKTSKYVKRRMLLVDLCAEGQKALSDGKISISHATVIAQLSPASQKGVVKKVVQDRVSPQMLVDMLSFAELDPADLPDEVKVKVKERAQTTFSNAGIALDNLTWENRDIVALAKKELAEFLEKERKALREKGVTVFATPADLKSVYPKAKVWEQYGSSTQHGHSWDEAVKKLPNSTDFAVALCWENNQLKRHLFFLDPASLDKKVKEKTEVKTKKQSPAAIEAAEKELRMDRSERLKKRMGEFKHEWMIKTVNEVKTPAEIAKAVALEKLMENLSRTNVFGSDRGSDDFATKLRGDVAKASGVNFRYSKIEDFEDYDMELKDFLAIPAKQVDAFILRAGIAYAHKQDDDWLKELLSAVKVKTEDYFLISKEFLELHTTDQLLEMAKELKLKTAENVGSMKKSELVDHILTFDLKGKVPRAFEKA